MPRKNPTKEPASAYDRALALLVRREHSSRELKRKLAQRGFDADASSAALKILRERNEQSDQRYAESLLRQRVSDGYGPRRIKVELQSHGLPDDAIRALLAAAAPDWRAVALARLQRRYGSEPAATAAERAKRAQFLLRRGFDAATVRGLTGATPASPDPS